MHDRRGQRIAISDFLKVHLSATLRLYGDIYALVYISSGRGLADHDVRKAIVFGRNRNWYFSPGPANIFIWM